MKFQSTKVIIINIVVTFVEGFAPAWAITGDQVTKSALVGAGAAGVSLVWNTVVKPLFKSKGILYNK